jgi:hypothetical protein
LATYFLYDLEGRLKVLDYVWKKPAITFYLERFGKPEREPFLVVKARKLTASRNDESKIGCALEEFFPLMGNIDYISGKEGKADRYVLCWFDDREDDFDRAFRRLTGVTFPEGATFVTDERGKRSYSAKFEAKHGKLE